jgi:hypothetical protein
VSRVVCVIGMHRSGTSSLAGSLQEAGLHLGDVITEAPHNAKGNRENRRIMDLQEALLVHNGGRWDVPPERLEWTDEHRAARDAIIGSYAGRDPWGFKDPRTLLTLPFWQEVLSDITFVATFRHPLRVAESLLRRNGGERERWIELWAAYNERLLALHARHGFEVVSFDGSEAAYRAALVRVVGALGLAPPAELGFFEPTLRHHVVHDAVALPPRAEALYAALCEAAAAGGPA